MQMLILLEDGVLLEGPEGEFPATIFEPAKVSEKILCTNNNNKQADHGLMGGSVFDHDLFPLPPLSNNFIPLTRELVHFIDATA